MCVFVSLRWMYELDNYYLQQPEPVKGCLLALRQIILKQDKDITAAWKYGMPFFCYRNKMFCYLWVSKTQHQPYIGFVEGDRLSHPRLIKEAHKRMKTILFDPNEDLPIETIEILLQKALDLYRKGIIKTQ